MKKAAIIILSAAAFIGGLFILYENRSVEQKTPVAPETNQQTGDSPKWETKIDDQENVAVAVSPLDLSPQSAEWRFDVTMNTHSAELDQDMTKSAVLVDDQGREYKPLKWEGPTGGHHREGVLTFPQITSTSRLIKLKFTGISDIVRIFTWQSK